MEQIVNDVQYIDIELCLAQYTILEYGRTEISEYLIAIFCLMEYNMFHINIIEVLPTSQLH